MSDNVQTSAAVLDPRAPAIKLTKLTKRYGETLALDNVSLEVAPNELFALIGPNGAGKTTLMHILCTILSPDGGSAEIAGHDVMRRPLRARRNLGVVFQEPSLDDRLTVEENLRFHGLVYQVPFRQLNTRITEMLAMVELSDWREQLVRNLSSGMKRRLEIARALVHNPAIVILDEPTVGLDVQSRARIWSYIATLREQRDLTVVLTTHQLEEVDGCDRVCIIDRGKIIAEATPAELKDSAGQQAVRVTPQDAAAAAAIRARYPEAETGATGELLLRQTNEGFVPAFLQEFGNRLTAFAVERPSLEDVFLSLTGRDLRDQAADAREQTKAFGKRGGEHTR